MFVCICRGVTEHQVEVAIESGATTVEAVSQACRAGGDCGACHGTIEAMIDDGFERRACTAGTGRLPVVHERARGVELPPAKRLSKRPEGAGAPWSP